MLKWLFHRSHNPSLVDIITDDPLATLHFRTTPGNNGIQNQGLREIYSVSRTNPLYSGDDLTKFDRNIFHKYFPKDSSRSAGSSSSGYSSQKQEQDEHEVDEQQQSSDVATCSRPVLTARGSGLEIDMEPDQEPQKEIKKTVPDPVWPTAPESQKFQQTETELNNSVAEIRSYQTSSENQSQVWKGRHVTKRLNNPYQPGIEMSTIGECPSFDETEEDKRCPLGSFNDDSIVTDDLLKMTDKSSCKTILSVDYQNSNDSPEDSPRRNEDMDKVIRELTVAVMKSRNVTSLTRALRSRKVDPMSCQISESSAINRGSFSRKKNNLRSSIRSIKNISKGSMSGVSLMRDLWRQTGMKTNGRKLIADGHDNDVVDIGVYPIRDIRCQKKQKNMNSRRNENLLSGYPKSRSPVSQTSDLTALYVEAKEKIPLTYTSSTEVYAEVYQEDQAEKPQIGSKPLRAKLRKCKRSVRKTEAIDLDEIEVGTSTTCYTSSSSSSSSSSGHKSSEKRVQFQPDVLDNETSGVKLLYDKVPRTSHHKLPSPYLIDLERLNYNRYHHPNSAWETFYGANDFLSGHISGSSSQHTEDSYKYIFSSPYFDYRKTHSKVGSTMGCSNLPMDQPHSKLIHQRYLHNKDIERKRFWKLFAIILGIGLVVVVIIALTIYIIFGKSVLVTTN